jgi:ribosome-associated heat shock protein Hsp15
MKMSDNQPVRIDKFLWATRIFKTRSQASEACRKGRIMINDNVARPSKTVAGDEILTVKKLPVTFTYRVICPVENRVSVKLVMNFIEDMTPENEKSRLLLNRVGFNGYRKKGRGRPTKKERRIIDRWANGFNDV